MNDIATLRKETNQLGGDRNAPRMFDGHGRLCNFPGVDVMVPVFQPPFFVDFGGAPVSSSLNLEGFGAW